MSVFFILDESILSEAFFRLFEDTVYVGFLNICLFLLCFFTFGGLLLLL